MGLAAFLPLGVANASDYLGDYPSRAACEVAKGIFANRPDTMTYGSYRCISNGNPVLHSEILG